ncbi:DUF6600 domain-containing protein [Paraburkholderia sp. BL10I2N1]|uniref:DUF6600 domain-containing protein n=1 Tax=Paraburkholderia sp. BL10I2N1 TaxID=1938796 RepID=UPI001061A987|nr:DUF6600 domain-containing protein [Paraburkholderia sp. BL10I2N1]TDN68992.1 FecR family protein [Paraburkholderia sp. BL10I2N1]
MKTHTTSLLTFRRLTGYALLAVAPFTLAAQTAFAQAAPPDMAPDASAAASRNTDPPGRVARLNYTSGAVTTEPAGASDWSYAQVNRPLTTGDQLWNDKGARSEMHIGSTAVRLGQSTSLDVLNLDDSNTQLKVAQGTLSTRVRSLQPGSSYELDTPNLALGITAPGDYRVDVAPDGSSTTVTVRSGSATAYGDSGQVPLQAGQQITFAGTSLQQAADNGAPRADAFDQWAANRDAAEDRSISARYVSRDVPGYQDLDANGTWRSSPQYGEVWVPNAVPEGWAPYHDGHWVWQAPWGWTWVDDAPWGFAPYHYGRWAYVDDTWAWAPGPVEVSEPPVYAPALVAFVGDGDNWGVNLAIGGAVAAAGVAWFPLGPGEPWHPRGGDWSPHYYERVNQSIVANSYNRQVNITNINVHNNTYINYRAPGAVTAVPATAFVHGQPTGRYAQKVDPRQWRNPQINPGAPGIAPVRESFGPGMRNANYRPPANVTARTVVATRNPVVPAAYRDNLAQHFAQSGGRVPGAGNPVVRTSMPAHVDYGQPHGVPGVPAQNVRVVQSHAPGAMPGRNDQAAQRPVEAGPNGGHLPFAGAPNGAPREQGASGQPRPEAPAQMANARPQPGNGVPRPPQTGGGIQNGGPEHAGQAAVVGQHPDGQGQPRREPVWTQQHTPMALQAQGQPQQRGAPQQPGNQPFAQQPRQELHPQPQQELHPQQPQQVREVPHQPPVPQSAQQAPRAPEVHAQPEPRAQEFRPQPQAQAQPRTEPRPQPQVQAQPRPEPRPQPQVQAQPRPEPRPQPQVQAQPRPEPRPQPQPRPEFHPQPVQQAQQPRPEPRPQPAPQPQPHPQPPQVQQPHPQPQPHQDQHANGGHEEHRKS